MTANMVITTLPLTQSICIPLITAPSRPLLERSLGLLRDNPASVGISMKAFVPVDILHLNMGINMSLSTKGRFALATQFLRKFDLRSLTRELSKPSLGERSIREKLLEIERSLSLSSAALLTSPCPCILRYPALLLLHYGVKTSWSRLLWPKALILRLLSVI